MKTRALNLLKWMVIFAIISLMIDFWRSKDISFDEIPTVVTLNLEGDRIDVNALSAEQPVIIYFWATWCPICKVVTPTVDILSEYYPTQTVALTSGSDEKMKQYLDYKGYHFDVINDQKGNYSREWGVSVTPTIYIVYQGKISSMTTGATTPFGIIARVWYAKLFG
ncbi:protein disulfide oxidoreductase [Vibrio sp. SS-MA-C1-2]|uniref:protein disulfide oxidoreductase n=1 Tax=Vibrio sp. SS-MA-C1-2 TaxID=2908646 RepID=UPI001F1D91BF|nr:protein disulfide oxidoreductase [Vibrio sp. SS-MA-C1-2]UJF17491.1 protein disulfide oxidoreductase [Vibrio sp. SS-MA-C1-2]